MYGFAAVPFPTQPYVAFNAARSPLSFATTCAGCTPPALACDVKIIANAVIITTAINMAKDNCNLDLMIDTPMRWAVLDPTTPGPLSGI